MGAPLASTEGAGNKAMEWLGSDEKQEALRVLK